MASKLRIAILECDIPIDSVRIQHGNYGDIFEKFLLGGAEKLRNNNWKLELQIRKWDVVVAQEYPRPEDVDAILLTGGRHNAFDNDPWILKLVDYVQKVFETRQARIIGICFGHQIIARATGARIGRNPEGWEISVTQINLNEGGSRLFGQNTLAIHQMHRDIVFEAPKDFQILGSSTQCGVQALYAPGRALTVQGHPEFDQFTTSKILQLRHKQGIFDDDLYNDGILRASFHHDGGLISSTICKFLVGEAAIDETT